MAQDLNDIKWKHGGIKAVFSVDEFRDAIQVYRGRVDDLKMDFLVTFPLPDFPCCISHSCIDPFSG